MRYTEFRDNMRNAPEMKRQFVNAGMGVATAAAYALTPPLGMLSTLAAISMTAEFSKRKDCDEVPEGFVENFFNFETKDYLKNCAVVIGSYYAVGILMAGLAGSPEESQDTSALEENALEESMEAAAPALQPIEYKPA